MSGFFPHGFTKAPGWKIWLAWMFGQRVTYEEIDFYCRTHVVIRTATWRGAIYVLGHQFKTF